MGLVVFGTNNIFYVTSLIIASSNGEISVRACCVIAYKSTVNLVGIDESMDSIYYCYVLQYALIYGADLMLREGWIL